MFISYLLGGGGGGDAAATAASAVAGDLQCLNKTSSG